MNPIYDVYIIWDIACIKLTNNMMFGIACSSKMWIHLILDGNGNFHGHDVFFLHSKVGESNFRGCQQVNHLQNELVWWINKYIKSKLYITCPLIHYATHTVNINYIVYYRAIQAHSLKLTNWRWFLVDINTVVRISGSKTGLPRGHLAFIFRSVCPIYTMISQSYSMRS